MKNSETKVAVLGLWHLGSVASACLAEIGYDVVGFEQDTKRVEDLNKAVPPLYEPSLAELVEKNISVGRLCFTSEIDKAVAGSKYVLICFDTPVNSKDEEDLTPILKTIDAMIPHLPKDCTIIVSSQVPVGSCDRFIKLVEESRPSLRFNLAYVPENLRLGQAIERYLHPDMLVIGAADTDTLKAVESFYEPIGALKVSMDLKTAEMTKHAINSYLAMQISFINEIANLCDKVGADALKVGEAMKFDKRIGPNAFLRPGLGFAGGTLTRDLKSLLKIAKDKSYPAHLIKAIVKVNTEQNRMILERLSEAMGSVRGLTISVYGLTYKPGTSTLRRSASIEIINALLHAGARVKTHDPKADLTELREKPGFEFYDDPYRAAEDSDALVFITNWPEFEKLDFIKIKKLVRKPVILDSQNSFDARKLRDQGFMYIGVGRGSTTGGDS